MPDNTILHKHLINARLLKSNGSWMYCNKCNSTIGYLCYSTYDYFTFSFICNCREQGSIQIGEQEKLSNNISSTMLLLKKGRLCCPFDQAPLFSIVAKNLKEYSYKVVCKKCKNCFEETK